MNTERAITCICPTHGRFALLRRAVAWFLAQDYAAKELLIVNDAPEPIQSDIPGVTVVNTKPFRTMWGKMQAALDLVETPYVAHWDDDDMYLPWHLSQAMGEMREGAKAVLPRGYLMAAGVGKKLECRKAEKFPVDEPFEHMLYPPAPEGWGKACAYAEAQMVFDRKAALSVGGYVEPGDRGQCVVLLLRMSDNGMVRSFDTMHSSGRFCPSFVHWRLHGAVHFSSIKDTPENRCRQFAAQHTDYGAEPLTAADVSDSVEAVLSTSEHLLPAAVWKTFRARLCDALDKE